MYRTVRVCKSPRRTKTRDTIRVVLTENEYVLQLRFYYGPKGTKNRPIGINLPLYMRSQNHM
jgi:hypothetical protein